MAEAAPIEWRDLAGSVALPASGGIGAAVGGPVTASCSLEWFDGRFNLNTVSWMPGNSTYPKNQIRNVVLPSENEGMNV